jgi:putative ABC transport system permease protein
MNPLAIFRIAVRALGRNKMRSALTMLGIIIGVGAVIAMVSIGEGVRAQVNEQIQSMGSNLLQIQPGNNQSGRGNTWGGVSQGAGSGNTLTDDDMTAIEREIPNVAAATPMVRANSQLIFGNQNWQVQVQGSNEKFPDIRSWTVEQGEFFNEADVRSAARVIVLGKTVADKLFAGVSPIGEMIRVRNLPFRVVGVLAVKGQSPNGQDQDDTAVAPYTAIQRKLLGQTIPSINQGMIKAHNPQGAAIAERQIKELLRQRHRIPQGESEDFTIRNMSEFAQTQEQVLMLLTILLGSIAGISLVVGGIGIMNIMLVSVTERTREIGIRMAVGARPSYIRLQFLTESLVLSLMGGVIGIVIGGGGAALISALANLPTLVSPLSVVVSFGFATVIGLFFGYYPAHKAAAMDPIEALRYE